MSTYCSRPAAQGHRHRQWDAADFIGRLIVVDHAAFIDAGFAKLQPPWAARPTGATPSLRYTIPKFVHRRRSAQGALASTLASDVNVSRVHWGSMDTRAIAGLLLSGSLDDAACALNTDATGVQLWKDVLADGLCQPTLDDLMGKIHERPTRFPGFMLPRGEHLAAVECTCTKLRRLIADRDGELWKAMLAGKIKRVSAALQGRDEAGELWKAGCMGTRVMDSASSTSWKGRYVRYLPGAWSNRSPWFWFDVCCCSLWSDFHRHWDWERRVHGVVPPPMPPWRHKQNYCRLDTRYDPSLLKDPLEPLMRQLLGAKSNAPIACRRAVQVAAVRQRRDLCSLSSRYRWMHR
uniref:Uncharacterized protein n=1 Tax=Setaria italica TaxID=4555 RepID=K4AIU2_SETIT